MPAHVKRHYMSVKLLQSIDATGMVLNVKFEDDNLCDPRAFDVQGGRLGYTPEGRKRRRKLYFNVNLYVAHTISETNGPLSGLMAEETQDGMHFTQCLAVLYFAAGNAQLRPVILNTGGFGACFGVQNMQHMQA